MRLIIIGGLFSETLLLYGLLASLKPQGNKKTWKIPQKVLDKGEDNSLMKWTWRMRRAVVVSTSIELWTTAVNLKVVLHKVIDIAYSVCMCTRSGPYKKMHLYKVKRQYAIAFLQNNVALSPCQTIQYQKILAFCSGNNKIAFILEKELSH